MLIIYFFIINYYNLIWAEADIPPFIAPFEFCTVISTENIWPDVTATGTLNVVTIPSPGLVIVVLLVCSDAINIYKHFYILGT